MDRLVVVASCGVHPHRLRSFAWEAAAFFKGSAAVKPNRAGINLSVRSPWSPHRAGINLGDKLRWAGGAK